MIQHLTRTGTLTSVMPRIYVSCHPVDFQLHFRAICTDIFAIQENCAIFYEDDPLADYKEEKLQEILSDMRLVVVPVTRRLLSESSRALDFEIPFAIATNISVLPVLMEEDDTGELIDAFNNTPVFSGLQFLNKYDKDKTALRYEEKLQTFLNSILISEEDMQRIHDEFSSKIFLSYRKKDRDSAQDLMKKIHKVDICRDTAIWYDEYLVPGESFDSNIMQALDNCDVFVMSVSEAFEEPGNYVADHEYPDAVRKKKPLVAARMKRFEPASLENLEVLYPGINALLIDPEDQDDFGVTLRQRLTEEAGIDEGDLLSDDGEHLYYIALAYKNGIRTVADPLQAAALFAISAENGCYESYLKLIRMYRMGDGVAKDYDTALSYCETAAARLNALTEKSLRTDSILALIFGEQGHIYEDLQRGEDAFEYYKLAYKVRMHMYCVYKEASLYDFCESMLTVARIVFSGGWFTDAKELVDDFISITGLFKGEEPEDKADSEEDISLLRSQARICSLMCEIYTQLRHHSEGIRYARYGVEICKRIEAATGSVKDLRELGDAYLKYADFLRIHDLNEANDYIDKYSEIRSRLAEYDLDQTKTISDAFDTFSIANNALMRVASGNSSFLDRAETLFKEVLEICSALKDGNDRFDALLLTAKVYRRYGDMNVAMSRFSRAALDHYEKALVVCKDMEKTYRNDIQIMRLMSELYDQIGEIYLKADDLSHATQYYTDALEMDLRSSRRYKDPGSKHNLAKSYLRCASVNAERGHQPVADVNHRNALKILEPLMEQTDDFRIAEDLAYTYFKLGMSERFTKEQRLDYYYKALHTYEYLLKITNGATKYVKLYDSVQKLINEQEA